MVYIIYKISGPMVENIKVVGRTENSMEKESSITSLQLNGKKVYGMMERESDGLHLKIDLKQIVDVDI